jgi:hypothetical protein
MPTKKSRSASAAGSRPARAELHGNDLGRPGDRLGHGQGRGQDRTLAAPRSSAGSGRLRRYEAKRAPGRHRGGEPHCVRQRKASLRPEAGAQALACDSNHRSKQDALIAAYCPGGRDAAA